MSGDLMSMKKTCILPCNGLDKSLGVIARTAALKVIEKDPEIELICPVLANAGNEKYEQILKKSEIIVVDGCMTRCVTKLLEKKGFRPKWKIFIPDKAKKYKLKPGKTLNLNEEGLQLSEKIATEIVESMKESADMVIESRKIDKIEYFEMRVDKFHFEVPKKGFYFNENDYWIKPDGDKALMGISDYLQNKASDIIMVDLPEIDQDVEQFDDVGNFESVKIVLQLISPGSGKILAVNKELEQAPELLNQDPYGKGWIVEIKLENFEEDEELLMNGAEYFEYMKGKVEEDKKHLNL